MALRVPGTNEEKLAVCRSLGSEWKMAGRTTSEQGEWRDGTVDDGVERRRSEVTGQRDNKTGGEVKGRRNGRMGPVDDRSGMWVQRAVRHNS